MNDKFVKALFNEYVNNYTAFTNKDSKTSIETTEYMEKQSNVINLLTAFTYSESFNINICELININSSNVPESIKTYLKELQNDKININEKFYEIFESEVKSWGFNDKSSMCYKVMMEIPKVATGRDTYDTILEKVAESLDKKKNIVASVVSSIIKHADFDNSKHMRVFANMPKKKISKQFFIETLVDFCN